AVHQRLAGTDVIALLDGEVLALGDEELACLAHLGGDDDLALALGVLAEAHRAVDLGDDRVILRLTRLEELRHARKTARDVLRLRGLARDLRENLARVDLLTVGRDDVRADRQEVAREVLADAGLLGLVRLRILDADPRTSARVTRLDDHAPRQTGDL